MSDTLDGCISWCGWHVGEQPEGAHGCPHCLRATALAYGRKVESRVELVWRYAAATYVSVGARDEPEDVLTEIAHKVEQRTAAECAEIADQLADQSVHMIGSEFYNGLHQAHVNVRDSIRARFGIKE